MEKKKEEREVDKVRLRVSWMAFTSRASESSSMSRRPKVGQYDSIGTALSVSDSSVEQN